MENKLENKKSYDIVQISDFLNDVYESFIEKIENEDKLCKLIDLRFDGNNIQDYNDEMIQEYYILRYTFGYAFEYKEMYKYILREMLKDGETKEIKELNIVSLGCGNYVDYYGLRRALEYRSLRDCKVNYTGIDLVDWSHKFKAEQSDILEFKHEDFENYIKSCEEFNFDILFMPKSISELNIEETCKKFENGNFKKSIFYLAVSLRDSDSDNKKIASLIESINKSGFDENFIDNCVPKNEKICELDKNLYYPGEVLNQIKDMRTKCKKYSNCDLVCTLNRYPILSGRELNYKIIKFERRK